MTTMTNDVLTTVQSKFDFSVDKFPLSGPESMATPFYGLFRSDSMECIGNSVKKVYVPHTTDDVLALVEAAGEAFDDSINVECHFNHGHYVNIAPSADYRRSVCGTADNVFPRFIVRAGYDGKAFAATMGYYRDLCSNLSMMRKVSGTTVSIRHTSGLRSKMDDLIQTFQVLKESWADLTDVIDRMTEREVVMTDFLDAIYGQPDSNSKRGVTVHKNRTEAIFRRLYREHRATSRDVFPTDFKVNAWLAYNAVQGYVQHDATRKNGQTGDFARIIASSNDRAVRTAEVLALDLAV